MLIHVNSMIKKITNMRDSVYIWTEVQIEHYF